MTDPGSGLPVWPLGEGRDAGSLGQEGTWWPIFNLFLFDPATPNSLMTIFDKVMGHFAEAPILYEIVQ